MLSRREVEELVLMSIGQIRTMEANLSCRYCTLADAGQEYRVQFQSSLRDLENRTRRLEGLLEALDQLAADAAPAAA